MKLSSLFVLTMLAASLSLSSAQIPVTNQNSTTPNRLALDGNPAPPPFPAARLVADGNPAPPFPPATRLVADGNPAPPFPPAARLVADGNPAPPFPPSLNGSPRMA